MVAHAAMENNESWLAGWLAAAGLSTHCNMQHASSVGVDDLSLPTLLEAVLFFFALLIVTWKLSVGRAS